MQEYHRFVSTNKGKSSSNAILQQTKSTQQNKQHMHNQDEKYIMESQGEQHNDEELGEEQEKPGQVEQDQVDPLDAFMSNLEQGIGKNEKPLKQDKRSPYIHGTNKQKLHQDQESEQDPNQKQLAEAQQSNWENQQGDESSQWHQQFNLNDSTDKQRDQQQQVFFQNQQGNNLGQPRQNPSKRQIEPLKPFNFSEVQLEDFQKDFYDEHEDILRLTEAQVKSFRKELEIKVSGTDVPKPIVSFGHLQLDDKMKKVITKQGFQKPTPIQAQALSVALKGRDLIGVAKTGSGKTLAYIWPMITHVGHQRQSKKGQGPVGLVLAPTRQLCQQIYMQTKKYAKRYQINVACLLGGENKHQQWKMLKVGVDVLIASPGRLIQMIKKKATNMHRVTFLVLDEADKMLSLGFQQQIRSIISQTRPDRQTLLFTATMKKCMQFLAFDILQSPIRINVGEENSANEDVKQQVVVVERRQQKLEWLKLHLQQKVQQGKILIFCNQKSTCEELKLFIEANLLLPALTLHGDKPQYERTTIMNSFKASEQILIATDIAGRGIDVKAIKNVVNFECPKTIQAYIHRIGRTGRAGETGTALSFLNKSQSSMKFAIELIKIFQNSGYPVSKQLQDLACLDDFYRRKRISSKMGVSFAKGKDASKFLNQILKKQQMGNTRAGLGMNPALTGYNVSSKPNTNFSSFVTPNRYSEENQDQNQKSIAQILKQKNLVADDLSISQLSKIIREQKLLKDKENLASTKLKSHFVRSSEGKIGNYQPQTQNQSSSNFQKASIIEDEQDERKRRQNAVTITFYKGGKNKNQQ